MNRDTLVAKLSEAISTPVSTPKARLCVATTTATVASMTTLVERGVSAGWQWSAGECPDGNHNHHRDQRCHRNLGDPVAQEHNQAKQHHARREG